MLQYLVRRLISAMVVLFGVSILTFSMMHMLPGDPVEYMFARTLGEGPPPEQVEEMRRQLGLDQPVHLQYVNYVLDGLRGDLGTSLYHRRPVTEIIAGNARYTMELAFGGLIIAILLGTTLGIIAAAKRGTWVDSVTMVVSLFGLSMPYFWLAVLMVLLFSITLGWLPATGQGTFRQMILPSLALGITSAGVITRLVRSSMLEVLRQEYITTARAKGVREPFVLVRHALRNAIIPPLTMVGLQFGILMGGAVVTETIFARRGLGTVLVDAILSHDMRLVQGILLFIAAVYIVANFAVDMLYAFVDPRIRYT
jgi:peptide/nickel transport system permease protein